MLCALHYANSVKSEERECASRCVMLYVLMLGTERVCKYVCDAVHVDAGKGEGVQVSV